MQKYAGSQEANAALMAKKKVNFGEIIKAYDFQLCVDRECCKVRQNCRRAHSAEEGSKAFAACLNEMRKHNPKASLFVRLSPEHWETAKKFGAVFDHGMVSFKYPDYLKWEEEFYNNQITIEKAYHELMAKDDVILTAEIAAEHAPTEKEQAWLDEQDEVDEDFNNPDGWAVFPPNPAEDVKKVYAETYASPEEFMKELSEALTAKQDEIVLAQYYSGPCTEFNGKKIPIVAW